MFDDGCKTRAENILCCGRCDAVNPAAILFPMRPPRQNEQFGARTRT